MKKNKIILTASLTAIAALTIPVPILITLKQNQEKPELQAKKYQLFNHEFDTENEAMDYGNASALKSATTIDEPMSWSLKMGDRLQNYNDPALANAYLESRIDSYPYQTSRNSLSLNSDHSLLDDEIKNLHFENSPNNELATAYRGKNNYFYDSEQKAKLSYLNIHEAYLYDNIYFKTKEELAIYLEKKLTKIDPSATKPQAVIIKGKNNQFSTPFLVSDIQNLNSPDRSDTKKAIYDFVENNYQNYFVVKDKENPTQYFNYENIDKIKENFSPNYTQLITNQSKGRYIVDLDKSDKYDLIGPYYVNSDDTIELMMDKKNWRKIDGNDYSIVTNIAHQQLIVKFFDSILGNNYNAKTDKIFDFQTGVQNPKLAKIASQLQKDVDAYFSVMQQEQPAIYQDLVDIYTTMKQGKRYSEFLKLPVIFLATIDRLLEQRCRQKYIDYTRKIYTEITDYYDLLVKYSLPKTFLKGAKGSDFDFTNLFEINNFNLDLSYDIESIVSKMYSAFPDLIKGIEFQGTCKSY